MLFEIKTTSGKKPENCIPIQLTRVDVRTFKSPEEYNERLGRTYGKWEHEGTNHRILPNGNIARDIGIMDCYGIEINSLEELMKFKDEVNQEIIIGESYIDKVTPSIEIYDDYRE